MDAVAGYADVDAGGEVVAVDGESAGEDLPWQQSAYGGRKTHRFVDAGEEEAAGCQGRPDADVLDIFESRADLSLQGFERVGVMEQVEDCGREARGGGAGAADDQDAGFGDELFVGVAAAGLGIFGFEQVAEEVAEAGVLAAGHAPVGDGFAEGLELAGVVGEFAEEELVEFEFEYKWHVT